MKNPNQTFIGGLVIGIAIGAALATLFWGHQFMAHVYPALMQ